MIPYTTTVEIPQGIIGDQRVVFTDDQLFFPRRQLRFHKNNILNIVEGAIDNRVKADYGNALRDKPMSRVIVNIMVPYPRSETGEDLSKEKTDWRIKKEALIKEFLKSSYQLYVDATGYEPNYMINISKETFEELSDFLWGTKHYRKI